MDRRERSSGMFHSYPLSTQVEAEIYQRFHKDSYRVGCLLPPENKLSIELGVSRGTVRSAYTSLHTKRLITVRHGIGAFFNNTPIRVRYGFCPCWQIWNTKELQREVKQEADQLGAGILGHAAKGWDEGVII